MWCCYLLAWWLSVGVCLCLVNWSWLLASCWVRGINKLWKVCSLTVPLVGLFFFVSFAMLERFCLNFSRPKLIHPSSPEGSAVEGCVNILLFSVICYLRIFSHASSICVSVGPPLRSRLKYLYMYWMIFNDFLETCSWFFRGWTLLTLVIPLTFYPASPWGSYFSFFCEISQQVLEDFQ